MHTRSSKSITFLALAMLSLGCGDAHEAPSETHSETALYLGQEAPGIDPEPFAPGIVNTEAMELNGVVSPDGNEFFFTRAKAGLFVMQVSNKNDDGSWSEPKPVYTYPDRAPGLAVDMAYSPDGSKLYFLGRYDPAWQNAGGSSDIFVIEREVDGWSLAERLPAPLNLPDSDEWYPSVASDGSLYFASDREGTLGGGDVWRAQMLPDGSFAEPVNLGAPINTEHHEGDTYVSPDESWLVVTSRRPGGIGGGDLYVSFRQEDGSWGEPKLLPEPINSELLDFCPMGTPDGHQFFFSRRNGGDWSDADECNVYWVDFAAIDALRN